MWHIVRDRLGIMSQQVFPPETIRRVRHDVSDVWYIIWKWFVRIGCTTDWYIDGRAVWGVPLRVHWVVKKKELVGVPLGYVPCSGHLVVTLRLVTRSDSRG